MTPDDDAPRLDLTRWAGPIDDDDPDAAFKEQVAEYSALDPTETLRGLAAYSGIPVGALARFVLAKWASSGSDGLLEIGPTMTEQLWTVVAEAERAGTDDARLTAYHRLAGMIGWLRAPLAP